MDDETKEISGYIHNVSPLKGSKSTYFDMVVQTKTDVYRAVCFSPKKHQDLQLKSNAKSPVKISNYKVEKTNTSTTILLNNTMKAEDTNVDFPAKPIPPTNNIASLMGVHYQQLVTITAKVTQLGGTKKVSTRSGLKEKAECYLVDPSGSIKLILWESLIQEVQDGKTYTFNNLRVLKEYNTEKLALGTTMESKIDMAPEFDQPLAHPLELPDSFTKCTAVAEIVGINTFGQYHSCRNCNKKIPEDSFTGAIVKCPNCKVAQKKDRCLTRCFVQAITQLNTTSKVTVTLFHEQIQEVFSLLGRPESLEENEVTLALLDGPLLDIVYDNKSKIVSQVSFHPE